MTVSVCRGFGASDSLIPAAKSYRLSILFYFIFNFRIHWHMDVLNVPRPYPETC